MYTLIEMITCDSSNNYDVKPKYIAEYENFNIILKAANEYLEEARRMNKYIMIEIKKDNEKIFIGIHKNGIITKSFKEGGCNG